ncbi:C-X-C motif chemokine 16 isoform X1 [Globicephala melas]|uniref:C-X-C motif chemokine 16 isoform X1 n=1 Tax=Globicephala melas TaxID=9731 RepID=UPI00293D59D8|nr:C-X-C motif chemokine 16 isoform X1 [Globicephala melas]
MGRGTRQAQRGAGGPAGAPQVCRADDGEEETFRKGGGTGQENLRRSGRRKRKPLRNRLEHVWESDRARRARDDAELGTPDPLAPTLSIVPHSSRFQLPLGSVCGGSSDRWVQELMRCFDREECGRAHTRSVAHQGHVAPRSTQVPEPTEQTPSATGTPSQKYLPSTLQPTQQPISPEGATLLDQKLIHTNETTTYTLGHRLGARPGARGNQRQLGENVGPAAGTSAMVPVLSLLGIVFLLTGALLYMLCEKRRKQSLQCPPDLHLHYVRVAADANA